MEAKSEVRDGMRIDWDVPIEMDDGLVLRADVFRPLQDGRYAVILSLGPYAKGLEFKQGYPSNWQRLVEAAPEVVEGSTNKYQNWELVDPERWVPAGYVCVRVDSRGAGRSPGFMNLWSKRETQDLYDCIEWAGVQPWSNGKVGLNGISYYAMNQWHVAPMRPPHLAALCVWEGNADFYREQARHGGILSDMVAGWYTRQVLNVQHGVGDRGKRSVVTGETVAGPETLSPAELEQNRDDLAGQLAKRELFDEFYAQRKGAVEKIDVPLLSAGNWGGQGIHPRGNFEGYLGAGTKQKWLEMHGHTHFTHFYSAYGEGLQRRFFDHFLKGEDSGWDKQPPVSLNIRRPGEHFTLRAENEWPLARTQWTKYYLTPGAMTLDTTAPGTETSITYEALGDGVRFYMPPMQEELEITGPLAAKLWISSETIDADIFLVLGVYDPSGKEVTFIGSNDPRTPVGLGWLRASHRKLDPELSTPYRPYHTHDEKQPLTPGEVYELDVEIWPTCIVVPPGYRVALTVRGKDYEVDGTDGAPPNAAYPMKGVGPMTHTLDRPAEIFGKNYTLHFAPGRQPYVLLPIIPPSDV
ncbi:CocE/NonD family hydrolase [Verticiella sediminum]|uniref:CocE/NonD family hydrolase n=1 Tax=Verticiella sediminum TaxID=1247510 RepID=A0A556AY91_9BURK|nr:CocE/NonD family hydrolase [Verticiella sediminum]TSH97892.1 CocE/NonD family hydrolase [Verticiella sediminum]